jgi:quercetin dioxygenase-like cupin family protein
LIDLEEVYMSTAPAPRPGYADPVSVDPKHYRVEFENDRVRVLRVNYGAHEKSVMHGHPACFAIFLNSSRAKFTFPDGKSEERSFKAGDTMSMPAETHLPENLDDKPLEVVLVEFK